MREKSWCNFYTNETLFAMDERCKKELSRMFAPQVKWDCPLAEYTSFRIGGPADALVMVENVAELKNLQQFITQYDLLWRIIGRGTNLLVRDQGFAGVVIVLTGDFKLYHFAEEPGDSVIAFVGAACGLSRLSSMCVEKGYSGLEFVCGIPGTVGGAILMNAGAWGGSMEDVVQSVEVMTSGEQKRYCEKDLSFGYRKMDTLTGEPGIILSAQLKLAKTIKEQVYTTCQGYRSMREAAQPTAYGSAGSIFKNPEGESAGRLIEASGLKGVRIGDAEVSDKHANFIVNRGRARAEDVLRLIEYIQVKVERDSGIFLEPEVHIL